MSCRKKPPHARPAEGKAAAVHKRQRFKRKPRGKKLGRRGEGGAGARVTEGGGKREDVSEGKPAVKIGMKRKASTRLEGTKRQKCKCKNSLNCILYYCISVGMDWGPDLDS